MTIVLNEELKIIISRYAHKPQIGKLVFPYISEKELRDEVIVKKKVAQLGKMIAKRMKVVTTVLKMPYSLSPTWARHSFATNLTQASIPKEYISWAMGHSDNSITSNYIASFSFKQMLRFNSFLLDKQSMAAKQEHLVKELAQLSRQELMMVLRDLIANYLIN